jgi:cytochrome d ubiquinol oxidase subunit I
VGRQPWVVYGLMRTSQGISPSVHSSHILASILMFVGVYALLFMLFLFLLNHKIKSGPAFTEEEIQDPRLTLQGRRADIHV